MSENKRKFKFCEHNRIFMSLLINFASIFLSAAVVNGLIVQNSLIHRNSGFKPISFKPIILYNQNDAKFTGMDDQIIGEYCSLVEEDDLDCNSDYSVEGFKREEDHIRDLVELFVEVSPLAASVLAFLSYGTVKSCFKVILEKLSNNNWQSVDGGTFQVQIITPAINGIIVPSISILFATLVGNTIATLRTRQQEIRTLINMEANELRTLQVLIDSYPKIPLGIVSDSEFSNMDILKDEVDSQDICRLYLIQYTSRLIKECRPNMVNSNLDRIESEMNGYQIQLNKMANVCNLEDPKQTDFVSAAILGESYAAISRLNSYRSSRISALQSTFPLLHYAILGVLSTSLCLVFLVETNQEILYFLNAFELSILWTMLIGTLTSLGVVCYGLSEPFRGSYQILSSVDQLYTTIGALRAAERENQFKVDYSEEQS